MPAVTDPTVRSVLPSFLLPPTVLVAAWAAVAPFVLGEASTGERLVTGTIPGTVAAFFALADHELWRRRGRPWHDWLVILLLLPAIGAAVWITVGALILDLRLGRDELLAGSVGPGVALVGLLCTTISYHGRHHPAERRS